MYIFPCENVLFYVGSGFTAYSHILVKNIKIKVPIYLFEKIEEKIEEKEMFLTKM